MSRPPLSWAFRQAILRLGRRRDFAAGEVIYREYSEGTSLFLIRSGEVRQFKSFFGKSRTLATLGRGDTLGEVSFFEGGERATSVQASTPVRALEFQRENLFPLLASDPDYCAFFLGRMAGRVRQVQQDLVEELVHRNLELEMANARLEARVREREELERSNEALSEKVQRDHLTGCLNRMALQERLTLWTSRPDKPFTLLLFDVDHFKQYNDRNGHLLGDELLKGLVTLVTSQLRSEDLLARFGGEEFAVMLSGLPPSLAPDVARRISDAIARHPFAEAAHQPLGTVSISSGLAFFPSEAHQPEALLQVADERLYQAKAGGRNRVVPGSLPLEDKLGLSR